jgi:hypothetical protein
MASPQMQLVYLSQMFKCLSRLEPSLSYPEIINAELESLHAQVLDVFDVNRS